MTDQFYLFGGREFYYASGGVNDFIKSHSNIAALQLIATMLESDETIQWWHIADHTMKIVARSSELPHLAESGAAYDYRIKRKNTP